MKKDQQFCYHHPDRLTFRRCYVCRKPICGECQVHKSHHIFCSNRCWLTYHFLQAWNSVKSFIRKGEVLISPWTLVVIFLVFLVWFGFQLQRIQSKLDRMQRSSLSPQISTQKDESEDLTMKITKPVNTKGMVYHNTLTIEGEADDNSVVMLLRNDRLVRSQQPEKGRFIFKDLKLAYGQNDFLVQMVSPNGDRLALETVDFVYNSPTVRYFSKPFNRGSVETTRIALTFDGGYLNNISGEILDYLNELNVKATFFLTGGFVDRFPETVKKIVAMGHEIGNHTMNHPHFTTFADDSRHHTRPEITRETVHRELEDMAVVFKKVTGKQVAPLWRAPYGEHNSEIRQWAAEAGYRQVGWTVGQGNGENMDTMDWVANPSEPGYLTAEQIQQKIFHFADSTDHGARGAVVLMHLGSNRDEDFPHRKLPEIVTGLRNRGYSFVTVSELMTESLKDASLR